MRIGCRCVNFAIVDANERTIRQIPGWDAEMEGKGLRRDDIVVEIGTKRVVGVADDIDRGIC